MIFCLHSLLPTALLSPSSRRWWTIRSLISNSLLSHPWRRDYSYSCDIISKYCLYKISNSHSLCFVIESDRQLCWFIVSRSLETTVTGAAEVLVIENNKICNSYDIHLSLNKRIHNTTDFICDRVILLLKRWYSKCALIKTREKEREVRKTCYWRSNSLRYRGSEVWIRKRNETGHVVNKVSSYKAS